MFVLKARAVKLFLGKLIFDRARLPRTSYRWQVYRTQSGKLRRYRVERQPERYHHSSTPRQQRSGLHYKEGQLRLRTINQTDLRTLTDKTAAKARPIASMSMKGYVNAINKAVDHFRNVIIAESKPTRRPSDP